MKWHIQVDICVEGDSRDDAETVARDALSTIDETLLAREIILLTPPRLEEE